MNAYWLYKQDGTKTDLSACGVCWKLAKGETNYDISEKCCTCYACGLPLSEQERGYANRHLYHDKCEREMRAKREADVLESAELVTDYDGPLFCEAVSGGWGDGYWAGMDDLLEALDDEETDDDRPEFAHCCIGTKVQIDLDRIIEDLTSDLHEEANESLSGVDELQLAVNVFNEANDQAISFCQDRKRKVAIPARNKP